MIKVDFKAKVFILSYSILFFVYAIVVSTYAYFHYTNEIDKYQLYESGEIKVQITSVPETINKQVKFFKTPLTKIDDVNYNNFNEDIVCLEINITNKSTFDIKSQLDLEIINGIEGLVYWVTFDRNNDYRAAILEDLLDVDISDFYLMKERLNEINNNKLELLSQTIIAPEEVSTIKIIFWLEWDYRPSDLNYNVLYKLKINSTQLSGDFS